MDMRVCALQWRRCMVCTTLPHAATGGYRDSAQVWLYVAVFSSMAWSPARHYICSPQGKP